MRIAYVTAYDAKDISQWSGLGYYIGRAFERQSAEVDYIGPVLENRSFTSRVRGALLHRLFHKGFWPQVEPSATEQIAGGVLAKMGDSKADVVVGLAANHLSRVQCRQPMVIWSDTPLAGLIDFYDYGTNLSSRTLRHIHQAEQEAIDRCAAVVYTSEWAASVARSAYQVAPEKVHCIPFGANLPENPSEDSVDSAIKSRPADVCRLLFLGVDWNRKGGDIALETVRLLNAGGVPAKLLVAGCTPPATALAMPFVEPLGFISKGTTQGQQRIAELIKSSHFLLLPTRAEAYGLVFAEASAYGVPSVTTDVGGVGGVVTNGVNGVRIPLDAPASVYCDWIRDIFLNQQRYQTLCLSAYNEFITRLNWDFAGRSMVELLRKVIAGHPPVQ